MEMKKHLGDLLVEAGIITSLTLQRALERQKSKGGMLGEILEQMGVITDEELVKALARQFGFKRVVSLVYQPFAKALLEMVPTDIAIQKLVFPIRVDDKNLYLAVSNPFDLDTFDFLSKRNNRVVVPVLATRHDLMETVSLHYQNFQSDRDSRKKIFVVDDDFNDAQAVELALVTEGFNVKATTDALMAMSLILEFMPDLVVCDAFMPRIDGFGILSQLREDARTAQIPVVMLTSQESGEDERKAVESGCIDIIPKPLRQQRIVARVKRAIRLTECMRQCEFSQQEY
ncbi:MAG: response regulator [Desulfuromonadaceae bacterium]